MARMLHTLKIIPPKRQIIDDIQKISTNPFFHIFIYNQLKVMRFLKSQEAPEKSVERTKRA
jgi:hypothetical protein